MSEQAFIDATMRSLSKKDNTLIGDEHANGTMAKIYKIMAENPAIFRQAAENGYTVFSIEFPSELQKFVDAYQNGEIDKHTLRLELLESDYQITHQDWLGPISRDEHIENLAQIVINAHEAGLTVLFADPNSSKEVQLLIDQINDAEQKMITAIQDKYEAIHGTRPQITTVDEAQNALDGLPANIRNEIQQQAAQTLDNITQTWQKMRYDDTDEFEYIRDHLTDTGGVLGLVGIAHLTNKYGPDIPGIDDLLEKLGSVGTIGVHTGESQTENGTDPVDVKIDIGAKQPNPYIPEYR